MLASPTCTLNMAIGSDVLLIIPLDERVPNDWAVERHGPRRQQKAEEGIQTFASKEWPGSRKFFRIRPLAALDAFLGDSPGVAHFVYPIVYRRRKRVTDPHAALPWLRHQLNRSLFIFIRVEHVSRTKICGPSCPGPHWFNFRSYSVGRNRR